jgi:hypothetical protein
LSQCSIDTPPPEKRAGAGHLPSFAILELLFRPADALLKPCFSGIFLYEKQVFESIDDSLYTAGNRKKSIILPGMPDWLRIRCNHRNFPGGISLRSDKYGEENRTNGWP